MSKFYLINPKLFATILGKIFEKKKLGGGGGKAGKVAKIVSNSFLPCRSLTYAIISVADFHFMQIKLPTVVSYNSD